MPYRGTVEVPELKHQTMADKLRTLSETKGRVKQLERAEAFWNRLASHAQARAKEGYTNATAREDLTKLQGEWVFAKAKEEGFGVSDGYEFPAIKSGYWIKVAW